MIYDSITSGSPTTYSYVSPETRADRYLRLSNLAADYCERAMVLGDGDTDVFAEMADALGEIARHTAFTRSGSGVLFEP